ncbi:hypothetical protein [Variovorax sp. OV700]|uniref:hypothetical protein n=1 Tax=Variovorax sp. OV700 TaxID=1882826 RepID=UPI001113E857|nr:hypothetical protein [Variovorax sp. OV700]
MKDIDELSIEFPPDFDARAEYEAEAEAEARGVLDDVMVSVGGRSFSFCFYTPERIKLEADLSLSATGSCLPLVNSVVVKKIDRLSIGQAVKYMHIGNYLRFTYSDPTTAG